MVYPSPTHDEGFNRNSTLMILAFLRDRGETLPVTEIVKCTGIRPDTVRKCLSILAENDFVDFKTISSDYSRGRKCVHYMYAG